jgi:hypothetical protein
MLLAIMAGVIIITYFIADLNSRSAWEIREKGYMTEIVNIKGQGENFTSRFLKSLVLLDQAREDRAFANYHFDLAFLWYNSALSEKNISSMETYKERGIENCTNALPFYLYSHLNFLEAETFFYDTKNFTENEKYEHILDLYVKLTDSGSKLTTLRYEASIYLTQLLENLTFDFTNNTAAFSTNVSDIQDLLNSTLIAYGNESQDYDNIQYDIDGYEFFDEIR